MSNAQRKGFETRIPAYEAQNGTDKLTNKQAKRVSRKIPRVVNQNLSTAQFG